MGAVRVKIPQAVVLLASGDVLVAGGDETVELYDPRRKRFRAVPGHVDDDLAFATATVMGSGDVLITGGYDRSITPTAHDWIYRGAESEPKH